METQECLDKLNTALITEGVPEEERLVRIQQLWECIQVADDWRAKNPVKPKVDAVVLLTPLKKLRYKETCCLSTIGVYLCLSAAFPNDFQLWAIGSLVLGWVPGFLYTRYYNRNIV